MNTKSVKTLKILIVEDDVIDRKQLERFLSKSSLCTYKVQCTEYLGNALELLDQDNFDITLLDLNLPDSSGIDTLAKISEKHPHVANIIVTGLDREDVILKAAVKGAQDYLIKGKFDRQMLSNSIHYAIKRKKTELAMRQREAQYNVLCESVN